MNRIAWSILATLLLGCASAQQISLPSGRPEIDIRSDKKVVIDAIANMYSRAGYAIKTVNDFSLVVDKPDTSVGSSILFGSRFAPTQNMRVSLNFSGMGDSTHILGRVEVVTNPGSGFEKVTDLSANALFVQNTLAEAKHLLEDGIVAK